MTVRLSEPTESFGFIAFEGLTPKPLTRQPVKKDAPIQVTATIDFISVT
ncbi:hypothetical protein [Pseudolactococcus insecticola]|nr:hypothetical protein [Lactococcus insecticola]